MKDLLITIKKILKKGANYIYGYRYTLFKIWCMSIVIQFVGGMFGVGPAVESIGSEITGFWFIFLLLLGSAIVGLKCTIESFIFAVIFIFILKSLKIIMKIGGPLIDIYLNLSPGQRVEYNIHIKTVDKEETVE